MKTFSVVALAMATTVALSACSVEDEPEEQTTEETSEDTSEDVAAETGDGAEDTGDAAEETGEAAEDTGEAAEQTGDAANYNGPACVEFFTEGGPLAERADATRASLDAGEITDTASFSQLTLLKSRLDATAEEAPEDIAALIKEVNAPFAEAVEIANEGGADVVDPESGTVTLPEIDTQASADAQTELETACTS